ncbi:LysR family transcriptional regulator [Pseudonocardia sp. CA-107938]|uniref:LysR family transcriptional regulator n=1 Tax=Pseudonocardia sp. CA-107938 TaxID=3240021 RepID=UPI003D8B5052
MDLDLRKLRYFVAVAQELHFGRAAARLHIAQPVLSRQIRAFEDELRTQLLDRSRRATALTPAGRRLLAEAPALLAAADELTRSVRGTAQLRVGFMPGITVTAEVRALRERRPDVDVVLVRTTWADQVESLHDGSVDIGYVRLPIDRSGLVLRPLFTEPRLVAMAAEHRLAAKESLAIADLADEHLLQEPDSVPEWRDVATELCTGRARPVPAFTSVEEKLEHVAAGAGIIVIPRSATAYYTRPDIVAVPVPELDPHQVCLAWPRGRHDALLAEFVDLAARLNAQVVASR